MELSNIGSEIAVSSSRQIQESINVGQGISSYGAFAAFIESNIAVIDQAASFLSQLAASKVTETLYNKQYHSDEHKIGSFIERNIHINEHKKNKLEGNRIVAATATMAVLDLGLKCSARGLAYLLNEKDKFLVCEEVYAILLSYIRNAQSGANVQRATIELNKIRNSFPIKTSEKAKLRKMHSNKDILLSELKFSSILTEENKSLRDSIAFFLSALDKQLYGSDTTDKKNLMNYYSMLELNGTFAENLLFENQFKCEEIYSEQLAYLQFSRAIMKNLFIEFPNIDIDNIVSRSYEMAKYDPYSERRKKVKSASKGAFLTIGGIISKNPSLAFNGLSTALSQFIPNDETLQTAKDKMGTWGISSNEFDIICQNSNLITETCNTSDLLI